jgi:DNA-binding transcriptional regulator YhcF (GntR family)
MLPASIKITINKDSPIPLRDQIVEQIGLQIASGALQGNEKLPSIRALASKLDIHQGVVNAAYNQLAEIGMLEIRHGSGVRVVPKIGIGQNKASADLSSLFAQFVNQANQLGHSLQEINKCYEQFINRSPINKIVVVSDNSDFHPVILAELAPLLDIPVFTYTAAQLETNNAILDDSLIITSLYHFLSVQSLPLDPTRFLICNVEPAKEIVELIKSAPDNSVILLISVSPTLLKIAVNIAAALRGESIIVKSLLVDDTKELSYAIKHAKIIICDIPSKERVLQLTNKLPVHVFNLYSQTTIQLIKKALEK